MFFAPHVGLWKAQPFLDSLARHFTVLVPSAPGFDGSPTDPSLSTVDDLSYLYLDLLELLDLRDLVLVGSSFGGWLATAIAIKDSSRIASLILVDPTGAHFGGPEDEGIADVFSMGELEFADRAFAVEARGRKNYPDLTDAELLVSSRNREAAARYAWMPCLYDPKMANRLHRVDVPTLLLWGESDRITARDYAEKMAAAIPGAMLDTIAGAGHFPHIETPDVLVARIQSFAGAARARSVGAELAAS